MELKKFKEKGISFDFESDMVNATDMARSFKGKHVADFMRLKATQEYINVLKSDMGIPITIVKRGGTGQGTWMYKFLAYEFASWLSPKFKLFVYKVFDNHLQKQLQKLEAEKMDLKRENKVLDYGLTQEIKNNKKYDTWHTGFH